MNKNNGYEEQDSLKDVIEFQNNMFNPGYYVGTGKVPPTVSAPGNAMPLAVGYFIAAAFFLGLGLFLFFGDVAVTSSGFIESPLANKVICLLIMSAISFFCMAMGLSYHKKARKYYRAKRALESEKTDESTEDKIWQRTCPKCGKSHDLDYPKCPYCGNNYL